MSDPSLAPTTRAIPMSKAEHRLTKTPGEHWSNRAAARACLRSQREVRLTPGVLGHPQSARGTRRSNRTRTRRDYGAGLVGHGPLRAEERTGAIAGGRIRPAP